MILEVRASPILRRSRQAGEGACIERCGEAMLPVAVLRSVEISGVWAAKEADVPYPKRQHRPVAHRARRRGRRTGCSQAPGCSHWVLKPAPSVRVTKAGVGGWCRRHGSLSGPSWAGNRALEGRRPTASDHPQGAASRSTASSEAGASSGTRGCERRQAERGKRGSPLSPPPGRG